MPSWEDYIRQNAGLPIQQAANRMGRATDELVDPRLEALQKLANRPSAPMPSGDMGGVVPNQPAPTQQMAPGGMPMGGMGSSVGAGAGTIDEIQAHNKALLDMYNAASAEKAAGNQPEEDMSGYQKVDRFQNLKKQIDDTGNEDEDDEGPNQKGSSRETGTRGGI